MSWMINEDYTQEDRDGREATNFEIVLEGQVRDQVTGGGQSDVTNPFANPQIEIVEQVQLANTTVHFSGSDGIPAGPDEEHHFGIYGDGRKPRVLAKAWSFPTDPKIVAVAKSNFDFVYNRMKKELVLVVENTSVDTVSFKDVGFLIYEDERPIEDLTREVLPPSAFKPLPNLNHEYKPGDVDKAEIQNVEAGSYIVSFGSVLFSGPSAKNPHKGTGGEWAQVKISAVRTVGKNAARDAADEAKEANRLA